MVHLLLLRYFRLRESPLQSGVYSHHPVNPLCENSLMASSGPFSSYFLTSCLPEALYPHRFFSPRLPSCSSFSFCTNSWASFPLPSLILPLLQGSVLAPVFFVFFFFHYALSSWANSSTHIHLTTSTILCSFFCLECSPLSPCSFHPSKLLLVIPSSSRVFFSP